MVIQALNDDDNVVVMILDQMYRHLHNNMTFTVCVYVDNKFFFYIVGKKEKKTYRIHMIEEKKEGTT